jgi:hypothetical protein
VLASGRQAGTNTCVYVDQTYWVVNQSGALVLLHVGLRDYKGMMDLARAKCV